MATSITVNAANLNRPGVFIAQSATGGLPQPIATHAVGYLFGTTPAEEYYGAGAEGIYSSFLPYTPTQVASAQDFLDKIGGSTPTGSRGALTTYDSVKAYFDNVGVNGILYFTRVTPTPETVIDLQPSGAGTGYNAFALKVNGRYFGTPIGVPDDSGDEIKVITTTGIDKLDNARDLYEYLSSNSSDNFSDFYRVEQTADEALLGRFRIFARDNSVLPEVNDFFAYNINDTQYATKLSLNTADVIKVYTSVKEVNFRCNSRDIATGEPVLYVDGSALSLFVAAANTATPGTYDMTDASDKSAALIAFLADQDIYASVPDGKIVAVSKDFTSGVGSGDEWPDADAAYWKYDATATPTPLFTKIVSGANAVVPTGAISAGVRSGYMPDSVQVFYIRVAGENRAVIVNGEDPDELAENLRDEIISILQEKDLAKYYNVEAVASGSEYSAGAYAPNNGYKVIDNLVSSHGSPFIRPDINDIQLTGTVAVSGGNVTGVGTSFTQELGVGSVFVAGGTRFTVTTLTSDTALVVTPANVTVAAGTNAFIDKSIANGFFSHDYVLKVKITSKNGIVSPVLPGTNRQGLVDDKVVKLTSIDENVGYASYKMSAQAKGQDFVYAIEKGMGDEYYAPGFLFAPEAYSELAYEAGSDLASKSDAASERLKVTQTLVAAAEGRFGTTEGITNTQHMALIDCGGDIENVSEAQDELSLIKRVVGVPFGHAAYFAPYLQNTNDRFVPASGYVAGIASSRYINEGFQQPPAGSRYPLRGVTDVKFRISAQQQEVTYALGLNPIRSLPNRGIVVWGSRTLSSSPLFRFVNTRVILNALIDVMNRSFDDILFESIDSAGTVYSKVSSIATQILNQFYNQGALFGSAPEQAYLVVCGDSNNTPELLEQGTVRMDAYVATSPTLERLAVTIVRTPLGQVSLLSDSFSRNGERFDAFLRATNLGV